MTTAVAPLTIGEGVFNYLASYASATVTATVTGIVQEGTKFTLTGIGETTYTGTYANGVVTFANVSGYNLGDSLSYTITAANGSTGYKEVTTTVGTKASWIDQKKGSITSANWTNGPAFGDGETAEIYNATFTPTAASAGDVVTLTTQVAFGAAADEEFVVGSDAQAAVKIAAKSADSTKFVFYVLTNATDKTWAETTTEANGETTYTVEVKLNYLTDTYTVKVDETPLSAGETTEFPIATAGSSKVTSVAYNGTGTFTSLAGSYVAGEAIAVDPSGGELANVTIPNSFVAKYLGDKTIAEARTALAPDSTVLCDNGYNYFANYALGLDPTDEDDKPEVRVTTNEDGKFVVTLTDKNGKTLDVAPNVAVTLSVKTGTTPESVSEEGAEGEIVEGDETGESQFFVIDPTMVESVKYYKVQINIGAQTE